jgi:acetyl esterase/lipase
MKTETVLRGLTRTLLRPLLSPRVPFGVQRAFGSLASVIPLARGVQASQTTLGSCPATVFTPLKANGAILFLHGGGYVMGGRGSHGGLASLLARATSSTVWLLEYRLAPEHPLPAALDDALAAWHALVSTDTVPALVGDSAGAGLALATTLALRDARAPLPHALGLLSPWVDLTLAGDSITTRADADPMLRRAWLARCAEVYCGSAPPSDPRASPLFARLDGLPRMTIQVGEDEILLDDAVRLAERAKAAGVDVELHRYPDMWHDFQMFARELPVAADALSALAARL